MEFILRPVVDYGSFSCNVLDPLDSELGRSGCGPNSIVVEIVVETVGSEARFRDAQLCKFNSTWDICGKGGLRGCE